MRTPSPRPTMVGQYKSFTNTSALCARTNTRKCACFPRRPDGPRTTRARHWTLTSLNTAAESAARRARKDIRELFKTRRSAGRRSLSSIIPRPGSAAATLFLRCTGVTVATPGTFACGNFERLRVANQLKNTERARHFSMIIIYNPSLNYCSFDLKFDRLLSPIPINSPSALDISMP